MKTQDIRRQFLQYFKDHGHSIIASSPVLPHGDPTLLFTNAGMNQFKDVFLGQSPRDYKRAATSQKCIRAGGKHNDLDNVGHTSRHLTFFEMLGNFSFGDYFKEDAIKFAWEVSTQIFKLDPARIYPTVFREDNEAFELWTKYVPRDRITRFDEKDNFWAMGDTGPCGPCSELLYDRGPAYGKASKPSEDTTGERFLEYWNLVFMQFNRNASGVMEPLPKPSIDTGAGLERIVSMKMEVESVFETDVLRGLIGKVEEVSGIPYKVNDEKAPAFRVIADHLRCLSFAIADGVQPSNVDRGYVLRKILRRAVRYGRMLGLDEPFLAKILPRLVELMGPDYKELEKSQQRIAEILTNEEEAFLRTMHRGGNMLNQIIEHAQRHGKTISGDEAFKLKDTYGFPIEEILLLAHDSSLTVDLERYQKLEQEAKERSRNVHKTVHQVAEESLYANFAKQNGPTQFVGYHSTKSDSKVVGIIMDGQFVSEITEGQEGMILLDKTPFYAEMGGQVGDTGVLNQHQNKIFKVADTKSAYKELIAHVGKMEKGTLKVDDALTAVIDSARRQKIANNHTATHLLHWALHHVLGEHVKQGGSVVEPVRLRFDFSHHKALSEQEIKHIEDIVNAKIRENHLVKGYELNYEDVQKREDIKQFFGEKYGSVVRVIDMDYSKELCGGTHTTAVGNIGLFKIAKESSIAAGVRRIEALTGEEAEALARESEQALMDLSTLLKTQPQKIQERIEKLLEENKQMANELKNAKKAQIEGLVSTLIGKVEVINQTPLIAANVDLGPEELRLCADDIMSKWKTGVLVLASGNGDKAQILIRVSDDLVGRGIKAGDIIKVIAPIVDGTGGGKPNSAQAGGKAPQRIPEALAKTRELF